MEVEAEGEKDEENRDEEEEEREEGRRKTAVTSSASAPSAPPAPTSTSPTGAASTVRGSRGEGRVPQERAGSAQEVRKPRPGVIPRTPTHKEIYEHLPLHLPYRSWCTICVQSARVHDPHPSHEGDLDGQLGTTIGLDYCFFGGQEV